MLFLPPLDILPLKVCSEGVFLYIKATPKSSKDLIGKIDAGAHHPVLKVYVRAVAEDGKANDAIINILQETLFLKKNDIVLKSGHTQRLKTFFIKNKTLEDLAPILLKCV